MAATGASISLSRRLLRRVLWSQMGKESSDVICVVDRSWSCVVHWSCSGWAVSAGGGLEGRGGRRGRGDRREERERREKREKRKGGVTHAFQ